MSGDDPCMSDTVTLSDQDFASMEALLAGLLAQADDAQEEAKILSIHARLERIHATSRSHQSARMRLLARLDNANGTVSSAKRPDVTN